MKAVCFLTFESRNQLTITPVGVLVRVVNKPKFKGVDMELISVGGLCGMLPPFEFHHICA